ncbi:hypothetical protein L207DRAFT_440254 [Hyaloscypha variabilis F]|uniref:C6 transcription factor n=1 Tax=Hyaloscypha variabilis (strain UAMH 11265 / GT02V1 / F) TaxID=1149755 RepID=A0A2J6R2H8_HYAVF|nr:hypothetical protein L207DRAFT_440254 [Hyaloscypha variabilis F]
MPEDIRPIEVPEDQVEQFALGAFFYDYPIISTNREMSRGYLDGLEGMLQQLGPQSDLAKACKVVGFAAHGIKLRRPHLTKRAESFYQDLLGTLARGIDDPAFATSAESLMIAMLLGLYEIVMADENRPGNHQFHARGVAAILQIENSPLDLFGAVHFIRSGHPVISNEATRNCGIFSAAPHHEKGGQSLDDLLLAFGSVWRRANTLLANKSDVPDLYQLKQEAMALERDFEEWQRLRCPSFNPRIVGHVNPTRNGTRHNVGCWPGRVDAYFDLYVAGVWNTSRTARLLLISLILKLSSVVHDAQCHAREHKEALILVGDIIASIPYHLTDELQNFLDEGGKGGKSLEPGRPVGGLLLMHPIYVASTLLIVPQEMREYLKDCLSWIGINMGIGQASVFAKAPKIDKQYFADGSLLVWAGMLV